MGHGGTASQSTRSMLFGRGFAGLFARAIKLARYNDVHMKQESPHPHPTLPSLHLPMALPAKMPAGATYVERALHLVEGGAKEILRLRGQRIGG